MEIVTPTGQRLHILPSSLPLYERRGCRPVTPLKQAAEEIDAETERLRQAGAADTAPELPDDNPDPEQPPPAPDAKRKPRRRTRGTTKPDQVDTTPNTKEH